MPRLELRVDSDFGPAVFLVFHVTREERRVTALVLRGGVEVARLNDVSSSVK